MRPFLEIARTGADSLRLHPLRSLVTVFAVTVVTTPFLAGIGIARGLHDEVDAAIRAGADLVATGEQFGVPVPIPMTAADELRKIPGVVDVVPRIVGRIEIGKERVPATVLGVPLDRLPPTLECIEGQLYRGETRNELVVGSDLARQLHLEVGSRIPPFYRSRAGEHVSKIVGIFRAGAAPWQGRLILTQVETAERIFDQPGLATEMLVWCQPGYADGIQAAIVKNAKLFDAESRIRPRAATREERAARMLRDPLMREGAFTMMWILAFSAAMLVVLVTSGVGLPHRRREVGILKALGWHTDELVVRSAAESFLLSLIAASLSIILAFMWLSTGSVGIAEYFLAGAPEFGEIDVPFRLDAAPALLGFSISFTIVAAGGAAATWRAARTPPREAMR